MTAVTIVPMTPDAVAALVKAAVAEAFIAHAATTGDLWGVADLARHYRCSERTIRNSEKAGDLPKRSGSTWRRAEVLAWDRDRRE